MNSVMSAGNNGDVERSIEEKKVAARASSRKGRMKGQGGPLNASCTFKGVRQRTWGRWVSEIRQPKTKARIWLGTFSSAREAAIAYDEAARKLFGPNARLNLPDEVPPPPPEPTASQKALALATASSNTRYKMKQYMQIIRSGACGVVNCAMNDRYPLNHINDKPNLKESVGENSVCFEPSFKNLNSELQEFDDSAMWKEAVCTMDYHSQAICDPGIAAMAFGDAIGIELKHPLMV